MSLYPVVWGREQLNQERNESGGGFLHTLPIRFYGEGLLDTSFSMPREVTEAGWAVKWEGRY